VLSFDRCAPIGALWFLGVGGDRQAGDSGG
jgi:hypothetical protein